MTQRQEQNKTKEKLNRRSFMHSTAAIGTGLFLATGACSKNEPAAAKAASAAASAPTTTGEDVNVAILGAGTQGQVLMNAVMKLGKESGIKFRAVCDIWEKQNLRRVSRTLDAYKIYGHKGTAYTDYREMLDKEADGLDAVIIATPDFWHSEHTVACLEAGLHVYCEKEMSNTLEGARKMVNAAKKTGKLLQIGHQRRSNPRYIHCYEKFIKEAALLGRITTINGQWNRSKSACDDNVAPPGTELDIATLNKYGFDSMEQFLNWRWYKGKGGGPIVDLGSHQIDIYSWFLDAVPISVMASGGVDYWTDHEWYDNVMAIYEFQTKSGLVRAFYQTLTTSGNGGYFEMFMGDEGALKMSEGVSKGTVYREPAVHEGDWDEWVQKGYVVKKEGLEQTTTSVDARTSPPPPSYSIPVPMDVPFHQPHLVNFFEAVRGNAELNCPAEIGYETAVMVLKVNEAVAAGRKLDFKPEDFHV